MYPADQYLLGLRWQGVVYCDRALPFGLCSAPILFTGVADGLVWAMASSGVSHLLHCLDDFLFWAQCSSQCAFVKDLVFLQHQARLLALQQCSHSLESQSTLTGKNSNGQAEREIVMVLYQKECHQTPAGVTTWPSHSCHLGDSSWLTLYPPPC